MTRVVALIAVLAMIAGCAPARVAPPLPAVLAHPEFLYPIVPAGFAGAPEAGGVDRGWRYLQTGDLRNADREFAAALQGSPAFYPARTGSAYVDLARSDFEQALAGFDGALRTASMYVPALVGRGQALLALNRDEAALQSFEAALAVDPSLATVRQRVDVLRFRVLEAVIQSARSAASAGRLDEAAQAYTRAVAASPESPFLYRELGLVERSRGNTDAALGHFRRAAELDPRDATTLVQIAELLETRQDFTGAEAAYRRALALDPSAELAGRVAAVAERAAEAKLPAEFRVAATSAQITRGELAALIGVRLDEVLRTAPTREVVMTDVGGHWAAPWINVVARTGVIEPFPNHTFQPRSPITRADLATAVSRVVMLLAGRRPELRPHLTARPQIADMAAGHLSYPAAAVAVTSDVMPLAPDGRFDVARPVSGAEATEAIARLRALAGGR